MTYAKHIFTILSLGLITLTTFAQNERTSEAVEYSSRIIEIHNGFNQMNIDYTIKTIHSDDLAFNEKLRSQIETVLNESLGHLKSLPDFYGDSKLRDEAVEVFELYKESYSIDLDNVDLLKKDRESSFEAMESYIKAEDKASEKITKTSEKFNEAYQDFAKKYEFTINQSDVKDERVEALAGASKYSRSIFLEFFRVSKSAGEFFDALDEGKANAMESTRKDLLENSDKALAALKALKPFKGEKIYIHAAKEFVLYHKNLAENGLKDLVTIQKKGNENFTQEDVDRYNSVVQEYNVQNVKLVNDFNNANRNMMRQTVPQN